MPGKQLNLITRKATLIDHDAIWAMLKPVFRAGDTYAVDPDISREDALAYWLAEHTYVIEDKGTPIGTYYIRRNQPGGGRHVCNCGFVTGRRTESKGVARTMLAHALGEAKRLEFEAMQFNFVLETNARAVAIWKGAGFDIVGRLPRAFRMPDGRISDAFIMHRHL